MLEYDMSYQSMKIIVSVPHWPLKDQLVDFSTILRKHIPKSSTVNHACDGQYLILQAKLPQGSVDSPLALKIVEKLFSDIPWSVRLSWGAKSSRPVRAITILLDNENLEGTIFNIKIDDSLNHVKVLPMEERKELLQESVKNLGEEFKHVSIPQPIILANCAILRNPTALCFLLPEKYVYLGEGIISYFLFKEHLGFLHEGNCILFLERDTNIADLKKKFVFSVDAKLFDVHDRVQRDLKEESI